MATYVTARLRWFASAVLVLLLAGFGSVNSATPAHAAINLDANYQQISFNNLRTVGSGAGVGFTHRYTNAITIGSDVVDALVTVTSIDDTVITYVDYAQTPADFINTWLKPTLKTETSTTYRVDFVISDTNTPVTLQHVAINVADIDLKQFVQFSGVQAYSLSSTPNTTKLVVQTNSDLATIPVGAYRFYEPLNQMSDDTDQRYWAQVKYNEASSLNITLGARTSGTAYYGVNFATAPWTYSTETIITPSPYTLTYDGNTATGGSAPPSTTGTGTLTVESNSGPFTKPGYAFYGWNTDPDGSGVSYDPNDDITPTANMTLYAIWVPSNPELAITKLQASVDPAAAGDVVLYDISVRNVGNVPLTNVTVTDSNAVLTSCLTPIASLAVGEEVICNASHTTTNADVLAGSINNTALVTSAQITDPVSSNEVQTTVTTAADMDVVKYQTSPDPVFAGDVVTFKVVIVNVGRTASLTGVTLSDPSATIDSCAPSVPVANLPSTGVVECEVSRIVTAADIENGFVENTAFGQADGGISRTSNTVTAGIEPITRLDIEKVQTSIGTATVGDTITYNVVYTNSGNRQVTGVTPADLGADNFTCDGATPATLLAGQVMSCVATHVVVESDAQAGVYMNTAIATLNELPEQRSNTVSTQIAELPKTGTSSTDAVAQTLSALALLVTGAFLVIMRRRRASN